MPSSLVERVRTDSTTENEASAVTLLVMAVAGAWSLDASGGLAAFALVVRDFVLVAGGICLVAGVVGRSVSLPVDRKWLARAAAAAGFGAVVLNGLVAGQSLVRERGVVSTAGFTVVVAVVVGVTLGGLFTFFHDRGEQ